MTSRMPSIHSGVMEYWDVVDIELTSTGTVTITVPANSEVDDVVAQVLTAYDSGTSALLVVGDTANPDGFIVSSSAKLAANTKFGFTGATMGVYQGYKFYASADTIDCLLTITGATTTGKVRVWAHIRKFYQD